MLRSLVIHLTSNHFPDSYSVRVVLETVFSSHCNIGNLFIICESQTCTGDRPQLKKAGEGLWGVASVEPEGLYIRQKGGEGAIPVEGMP